MTDNHLNDKEQRKYDKKNRTESSDLFDRLLPKDNTVFDQINRNAKMLAQSALSRLDVVSRAEFDAQSAVLQRTRQKIEALEIEV